MVRSILKRNLGVERIGALLRHDEHFARCHAVRHTAEEDFGFTVEDGHRSIKGRGVFRETLSGIEAKE